MALHHASSGELIDIRPLRGEFKSAITKTLYKSRQLEVFRMVLLAGKTMPAHRVVGEVTVQCLEGSVELEVAGARQLMREGDLECLAGGEIHALEAMEDCSACTPAVTAPACALQRAARSCRVPERRRQTPS